MRTASRNSAELPSPEDISAEFRKLNNENLIRDADKAISNELKTLQNRSGCKVEEPPASVENFAAGLKIAPLPDYRRASTPAADVSKSAESLPESLFRSWDTWNNAGRALSIEDAIADQAVEEEANSSRMEEKK